MKIDFNAVLKDLTGKPMGDGRPVFKRDAAGNVQYDEASGLPIVLKEADPAKLGAVCIRALTATLPGDDGLEQGYRLGMYDLATRIAKGGVQTVTAEEVTILKERVHRMFDMVTFGACSKLLDTDLSPVRRAMTAKKKARK